MGESRILMGVIGRPHGVRGQMRVHSYTDDPAALPDYAPFESEDGRRWMVRWAAPGVATVAELVRGVPVPVADRTAAERLVNTRLYAARETLPPPAEDEFYWADLVGLRAETETGDTIGTVAAVHEYGAGPSLEIGPHIVPFTRAAVPVVDLPGRRLVVSLPAEVAP